MPIEIGIWKLSEKLEPIGYSRMNNYGEFPSDNHGWSSTGTGFL